MMLVGAVVVAILVNGNPADRRNEIDAFGSLKVAAQLDDEHAAVAIERNLGRILDHGLGHDRRQAIAWRQPEALDLFLWLHGQDRRLRREIGARVGRIARVRRRTWAPAASWRLNGTTGRVLRVGQQHHRQNQGSSHQASA